MKLYRHHDHALKICIWFGYIPPIIFCYFFSQFELSHFSGILTMKVNGQWVPCVHNSSNSLIQILLKLYRHCDHALKICMWLGYTPQINFCHFLVKTENEKRGFVMKVQAFCEEKGLRSFLGVFGYAESKNQCWQAEKWLLHHLICIFSRWPPRLRKTSTAANW